MSLKTISAIFIVLGLLFSLAACWQVQPTQTPTAVPTAVPTTSPNPTLTVTATLTPSATPTEAPTETPLPPTETVDVRQAILPTGTPVAEWQEYPIMPGALAGDGDEEAYRYTVYASNDEAAAFYARALQKLGWEVLATGTNDNDQVVMLFFMRDEQSMSISFINYEDDLLLIMMVK